MNTPQRGFVGGCLVGLVVGALLTATGVWWLGLATLWLPGRATVAPTPTLLAFPTPLPTRPGITATPTPLGTPSRPVTGSSVDVFLGFSEAYLNRLLRGWLPADGPIDRDMKLAVSDGNQLTMDGRIKVGVGPISVPAPVKLRVSVSAQNGRLKLTLDRAEAGPLPIPQQVLPEVARTALQGLEDDLNRRLRESSVTRDLRVGAVRTEPGRLMVEFYEGQ